MKANVKPKIDTFLVSFTDKHGKDDMLLIARKDKKEGLSIVNAIVGEEATNLYTKLTGTKKEEENG